MKKCRYCTNDSQYSISVEITENTERAAQFVKEQPWNKVIYLCNTCYAVYGDYVREYYGPTFNLGGAL